MVSLKESLKKVANAVFVDEKLIDELNEGDKIDYEKLNEPMTI